MNRPATSVIKNDEVRVGGRVRLGAAASHPVGPHGALTAGNTQPGGPASARIIKTAADHTVIEITCPCGTKTMLKCNY